MTISVRPYQPADAPAAVSIWNSVVEDGIAFPQEETLTTTEGDGFFQSQTHTGIAFDAETGEIAGLYILHPNNLGRCGHIANASYAVKRELRGNHIGEALVTDCLQKGRELGFRILQFNAVVATNTAALALYRKLGFHQLGTIPGGFRMDGAHYEDIILHYHEL